MNNKIQVLGTKLNEINFKILSDNDISSNSNSCNENKKLIFKKIDSNMDFGNNKFGISAETKFNYKNEKFALNASVSGIFVVNEEFRDVLIGNGKNIAGSSKGDELGNKIIPILANKFKTYLGLLSDEVYGYNIIPDYNFKGKK